MRAMRDDQLALLEEENRRSSEFNEEFEKEFGHVWSAKQQKPKRRNCGGGNKSLMDDLFLWYLVKRSREDDRW